MPLAVERFWTAIKTHSGPALHSEGHTLQYAELPAALDERIARLAELGARRIALALDNGLDWALWDLALMRAGLVCVPLPGFFSPSQQQHVLDDAGVDCLIAPPGGAGSAFGFVEHAPGIYRRTPPKVPELPIGTLKITYTSGTTGKPKGVCLDAEAQLRVAESLAAAASPLGVERHLCVLPLATLLENIGGIYAPLLSGSCVELRPLAQIGLSGASGFDPMRFLTTLQQCRPSSLILLPQLLLALVSLAEHGLPIPDSLRFIAVGGARVAPQLLERAERLGLPVYEGYGLSECASVVCLNTPQARRIGAVGVPLPHVQVRLAEDGEVMLKGARMLGYLGEPPVQGEWLASGDIGHFEDGFLYLHGRKKHQFVTAFGRNVNPEWVETELTLNPLIAQAWLYGEARPDNVAVLVPRQADASDEAIAKAVSAINQTLPDYARAHRWIRAEQPFTATNGLATANGRLRRAELLKHYEPAFADATPTPL